MRYVKKRIPVRATQVISGALPDEWLRPFISDGTLDVEGLQVQTLEGVMSFSSGDYLIEGVHGELYPCKQDIFEETYEVWDG